MAEPILRTELRLNVLTDPVDVERLLGDRRQAEDEALWQSTLQGGPAAVDVSEEGLAQSAEGAARMPKPASRAEPLSKATASVSEAVRDREVARLHEPEVRQAVSTVLRTLTGIGLDELDDAVVRGGTLPPAVMLKMLDPVGNTAEELARRESQKAGLPPELTEKIAASAGLVLSILFPIPPAGKAAKAGKAMKAGKTAKAPAGPDPRVERLRKLFMEERGSLIPDPSAVNAESRLNIERVEATAPVKELMTEISKRLGAGRLVEHRVVQTHAQTIAQSREVFPTLEDALAAPVSDLVLEKPKMLKFRDYLNTVGHVNIDLALRHVAGDADATAKMDMAFTLLADMAETFEVAQARLARGLDALKIMSEATRADVPHLTRAADQLRDTIAAERRAIEEVTAQLAETKKVSGFAKAEADLERVQAKLVNLQKQLDAAEEAKKVSERLTKEIASEKKVAEELQAEITLAGGPPIQEGYRRLYRGEPIPSGKAIPDWIEQGLRESGARDAQGRWYTDDVKIAEWYLREASAGGEASRLKYVDVPPDVFETSRVSKNQEAAKFSADPERELFIPRKWADKAKTLAGVGTAKLEADLDRAVKSTDTLEQKLAEALEGQKAGERLTKEIAEEKALAKELKTTIGEIRESTPNLEVQEARLLRSQELIEELTEQLKDARASVDYAMNLGAERGFNVKTIAELRRELRGVADADVIARGLLSLPREERATFAKNVIRYLKAGNDVIHWAFLQSLLSGLISHAANILGTGAILNWHIPERYLAEWIHLAFKSGPQGVQRGETAAMLRATGKGLSDGVRLMGHAIRTGEMPLGTPGRIETRFDITAAQFGWDPTTPLGKLADVVGMLTPTRLMMAEDGFYKGFTYTTEMAALALRQAMSEYPDLTRPGALAAMRRRVTMLEQVPTPGMMRAAKDAAALRTLNAELGPGGRALMTARDYLPSMSFLFPFVRTPINSYKWFHHRAPVLNLLSIQNWSDIAVGGARRDLAISRMLLGSAVGGAVVYHVLEGNITGGMSVGSNKALQRDLKAMGVQSYSIRVGDEHFYYKRTDPVGQYIGAIATAIEIYSQLSPDEQEDFDWPSFAVAISLAGSRVALDTPWLQGMSNVLDAIEKPDERGKALARNFVKNIVPAGIAQLAKSGIPGLVTPRPELKDIESIVDALKARSFAWADDVPPVLHPITGDLVIRPPGWGSDMISPIYVTQRVNDPVLDEIILNRMNFAEPSRMLTGEGDPEKMRLDPTHVPDGVKLNKHQYYRLKVLATQELMDGQGRTMHEAMTDEIAGENYQRASRGPDGGRELRLKTIYTNFYERARRQLRSEDADLDGRFRDQRRQRLERLRPELSSVTPQTDVQEALRRLTGTLGR